MGTPVPAAPKGAASVTTVLLALTSPSGSRSALPVLGRALPQAELLHRALVVRAGGGERVNCPELTGKDSTGKPLTGHRHAHLFPVDLDGDGHLDHIVVHAPMGLGPNAQRAIRGLKRTWTKGGVGELQVAVAGQGGIGDLRALPAPLDAGIEALLGPVLGARVWASLTPLVLPRHQKARGTNMLASQVNSESCRAVCRPPSLSCSPGTTRRSTCATQFASVAGRQSRRRSMPGSRSAWHSTNLCGDRSRSDTGHTSAWGCLRL